jgi:hypothetical protein
VSDDFASAAARHWEDAQKLFLDNRLDNSAYLAGYAVECSLKVLVQATGTAPRRLGHELAALSGDALLLACLMTPSVRRYHVPQSADFDDLVQHWTPEMRYWTTGTVTLSTAETWLRAAEQTYHAIVIEAALDGGSAIL